MLDGLLGRGFSSKCKSLIKATRTRIDVLRRRKEATQRFLKGNLAQLLSNGLDINAFGRGLIQTEEFLSGLNSLACYDFLEHSCEYILKKLSMMQKHSECPEECREAVGSLMFAAARFSDLPELRDLRDALQERYGNSLEHFVNQKFVERLAMKPPTTDKKIQLLQDIALELSIKWDSRGFQQRMMANPSAPAPAQVKKEETNLDRGTANNLNIDPETALNSNKPHQLLKMRSELTSDHRLKAKNGGESYLMRKDELGHRSFGGGESTSNSGKSRMGSERNTAKRDDYDHRGLHEKSELGNDEFLANKGEDNYAMRKDELGHRSFGRVTSTGNSGKPRMGSEENTARRYNYDMIPQERRDKSELSSDELRAKNGGRNYNMRKDEFGHRSFGGAESNSGKPHMGIEQNTPRGRRENGEISSDELRAKNRRGNYIMRNDELDHLSTGRGEQTFNNVKPSMGSKHNTHRRDYYDDTPLGGLQDGESSYGLGVTNGKGHYYIRKDEDILSPEQGDSRGSRCNLHTGLERSVPQKEKYGSISVGRLEEGKFDNDGLQAKHGKANYLMTNDELTHQTYRSDLRGTNTVRRETNSISSHHGREVTGDKYESTRMNGKEDTVQRRDGHVSSSRGKRPEVTGDVFEAHNDKIYGFPKSYDFVEKLPIIRDGKIVSSADCRDYKEPKAAKSHNISQEEDTYRVKPRSNYAMPPPYVKTKEKLVLPPYMKTVEGQKLISDHGGSSLDSTTHGRDNEKDLSYFENLRAGHARVRSLGHEKDVPYRDNIPLPKPRSIRRKHSKSSSHRDDLGDSEDSEVVKRSSSSRRRDHHHSKKGLQILFEEEHKQKDDEERKIDKLLLHYSKKPSTLDEEKARRKFKTHARDNEGEASGLPTRSVSLPRENITSEEQVKVYARANSFQPDKPAGHVHPKLPDYDDLAAKFAALKGR